MKKRILSICSLLIISSSLFSQIEVGANNNVGIGISGTVNSLLSVNTIGNSNSVISIYGDGTTTNGLNCSKAIASSSAAYTVGIRSNVLSGVGYAQGITGSAYNSTVYTTGKAYGVYGYAGNAQSGYNYGVKGLLLGSNNGAAIYGTSSNLDINTGGKYAGYFYGTTKVNGTLWVGSTSYTSDINAKKEIKELEKNNIEKIKTIQAIKYKYKTPEELGLVSKEVKDTASTAVLSEEMQQYYNKERIGLSAQEIQQVFPEIVTVDQQGMLGVDYIALIPVLLEAIKEQQNTIEGLSKEVENLKKKE